MSFTTLYQVNCKLRSSISFYFLCFIFLELDYADFFQVVVFLTIVFNYAFCSGQQRKFLLCLSLLHLWWMQSVASSRVLLKKEKYLEINYIAIL